MYYPASTWAVAKARRGGGLGDDVGGIATLPSTPTDLSPLLQLEPGLTVAPTGAPISSFLSSLFTPPAQYTPTGFVGLPTPTAAAAPASSNTLEYIGIAVAAVVVIALLAKRR